MTQPTTKAGWLARISACYDIPEPNIGFGPSILEDRIFRTLRGHDVFVNSELGNLRTHPLVGAIKETVLAGGSPTLADVASRLSGVALSEVQNNTASLEPMIEAILEREVQ